MTVSGIHDEYEWIECVWFLEGEIRFHSFRRDTIDVYVEMDDEG